MTSWWWITKRYRSDSGGDWSPPLRLGRRARDRERPGKKVVFSQGGLPEVDGALLPEFRGSGAVAVGPFERRRPAARCGRT